MNVRIEKAEPGDLERLMQWRMEVLEEVFSPLAEQTRGKLERENRRYYETAIPAGEHVACFAYADGALVGCGGICFYQEMPSPDNISGNCAYLMNIYTRPAARGQGVGREIVQFLLAQARARKITKIYLEASDSGRKLYEAMGFFPMDGYMKWEETGQRYGCDRKGDRGQERFEQIESSRE